MLPFSDCSLSILDGVLAWSIIRYSAILAGLLTITFDLVRVASLAAAIGILDQFTEALMEGG